MSTPTASLQPITGPGSVTGSPHLPDHFAETFRSVLVDVGGLRLHAVIGGGGPPLLLVGGWPQTWYAWRMLMLPLARRHTVIVVEPRGIGLSDKPATGYDSGTLAADSVALMRALGHSRFDMIGHDLGLWIGYALAADHPEAIDRLVLMEAMLPGVSPAAPLLGPPAANDRQWHFAFNRLNEVNEQLVRGRERVFLGHQFRSKAASATAIPDYAIDVYVDSVARSDDALRASFEFYRAIDETIAQNTQRMTRRLTGPILGIAGEAGLGGLIAATLALVTDHVVNVIIPDAGHYLPEEAPDAVLAAVTGFLDGDGQPGATR